MTLWIVLALVLGLAAWLVGIYNALVRNRNMVAEGFSGVEVQLKRRADLIPNLVETVKGYMGHEREVLEKVTDLRARAMQAVTPGEKAQAEGLLSRALGNLFAVAENYPDLKASQNFISLQGSLAEVEEQLQLARRYYNGAVRNLNTLIQSFPSVLVARRFGFTEAEFFEIEDAADRATPKVGF